MEAFSRICTVRTEFHAKFINDGTCEFLTDQRAQQTGHNNTVAKNPNYHESVYVSKTRQSG